MRTRHGWPTSDPDADRYNFCHGYLDRCDGLVLAQSFTSTLSEMKKERRKIKDRREKLPKEGLPPYYKRGNSDRRKT